MDLQWLHVIQKRPHLRFFIFKGKNMTIETLLENLITALNENAEALKSAGNGTASGTTEVTGDKASSKTEKTAKTEKAKKPTKTQAEMNTALIALKDKFGGEKAKEIIKSVGGVDKMADIPEDKYDAVFTAAEKRYEELEAESEEM
jgi:hypothetical protein